MDSSSSWCSNTKIHTHILARATSLCMRTHYKFDNTYLPTNSVKLMNVFPSRFFFRSRARSFVDQLPSLRSARQLYVPSLLSSRQLDLPSSRTTNDVSTITRRHYSERSHFDGSESPRCSLSLVFRYKKDLRETRVCQIEA